MKPIIRHITLLALLLLSSCIVVVHEQKQNDEQPVQCEVMTVHPTASLSRYTYMATVQAEAHIPLSLPFGGTITELRVRPNTPVSKGDILLRVDDTKARQALASAQASLTQAKDALRRTGHHRLEILTRKHEIHSKGTRRSPERNCRRRPAGHSDHIRENRAR